MNDMPRMLVINGASGAGKTTLANHLLTLAPALDQVHPDGLWDTPNLTAEEIFTRAATLVASMPNASVVVDCQIRPSHIDAIATRFGLDWLMVLLDCPDAVREARLTERGWNSEGFANVAHWQSVLREEAQAMGLPIIKTATTSVADSAREVFTLLHRPPLMPP